MKLRKTLAGLFLLLGVYISPNYAQIPDPPPRGLGSIYGNIYDFTGPQSGVSIYANATAGGSSYWQTSSDNGNFDFNHVEADRTYNLVFVNCQPNYPYTVYVGFQEQVWADVSRSCSNLYGFSVSNANKYGLNWMK